jgi:hypothetical protein
MINSEHLHLQSRLLFAILQYVLCYKKHETYIARKDDILYNGQMCSTRELMYINKL